MCVKVEDDEPDGGTCCGGCDMLLVVYSAPLLSDGRWRRRSEGLHVKHEPNDNERLLESAPRQRKRSRRRDVCFKVRG